MDFTRVNLDRWNEVTDIHVNSKFYDVEGFKNGKCTLMSVELEELGDVTGKSVLHLQCHFGMDSLSLSRLGAKVTGVDFSDRAISVAENLRDELSLAARFVCSDVYQVPNVIHDEFDVVFTSYGVIPWLSDLKRWADVIYTSLKPNGFFYIAETHPILSIYDLDETGQLVASYPYFNKAEIQCHSDVTYGDRSKKLRNTTSYQWDHTLSDVINALITAGLTIEFVHEFPYGAYEKFPGLMFKDQDGWWKFKANQFIPMLFSIKATKR